MSPPPSTKPASISSAARPTPPPRGAAHNPRPRRLHHQQAAARANALPRSLRCRPRKRRRPGRPPAPSPCATGTRPRPKPTSARPARPPPTTFGRPRRPQPATSSIRSKPNAPENHLASQPDAPAPHLALAETLAHQQRWAEAQQAWFQAHRSRPPRARHRLQPRRQLDHLGQRRPAASYYRKALDLANHQPARFREHCETRLKTLQAPEPAKIDDHQSRQDRLLDQASAGHRREPTGEAKLVPFKVVPQWRRRRPRRHRR